MYSDVWPKQNDSNKFGFPYRQGGGGVLRSCELHPPPSLFPLNLDWKYLYFFLGHLNGNWGGTGLHHWPNLILLTFTFTLSTIRRCFLYFCFLFFCCCIFFADVRCSGHVIWHCTGARRESRRTLHTRMLRMWAQYGVRILWHEWMLHLPKTMSNFPERGLQKPIHILTCGP